MQTQGKIQKWGNSSAIRLPSKVLIAAGIHNDSEVDIQAHNGRLVIQVHERTQEQAFDKLLASEPGAEELLALVKESLSNAINLTNETTARCYSVIEKIDQGES